MSIRGPCMESLWRPRRRKSGVRARLFSGPSGRSHAVEHPPIDFSLPCFVHFLLIRQVPREETWPSLLFLPTERSRAPRVARAFVITVLLSGLILRTRRWRLRRSNFQMKRRLTGREKRRRVIIASQDVDRCEEASPRIDNKARKIRSICNTEI